jgi:hypothetical protein
VQHHLWHWFLPIFVVVGFPATISYGGFIFGRSGKGVVMSKRTDKRPRHNAPLNSALRRRAGDL